MVLTAKQKEELFKSLLSFFDELGFEGSRRALESDAGITADKPLVDAFKGQLEKKWTAILRLQKRVMELESTVGQLQEELKGYSSGAVSKNKASGILLPVVPFKFSLQGHRGPVVAAAFNPLYATVASASEDATIKLWDYDTAQLERTFKGHTNTVQSVAFHPNGKLLASSSADLSVKLWDCENGQCLKTMFGHEHNVSCVAFIPPLGDQIVSCSRDKQIRIWEISTGFCVRTLMGHDDWVRRIACTADGQTLISASSDQTIRVWQISSGRSLNILRGHSHVVECIAIAPAVTNTTLIEFMGGEPAASASASSAPAPAGADANANQKERFLASGARDKLIHIWDLDTGRIVTTLKGHDNWIRSLVFHPGGQHLISCSDDRSVRIWDLKTGRCSKVFEQAHDHFVTAVDILKSSRLLVTGSVDETIRLWECR